MDRPDGNSAGGAREREAHREPLHGFALQLQQTVGRHARDEYDLPVREWNVPQSGRMVYDSRVNRE